MTAQIKEMQDRVRDWTIRKGWRGSDAPARTVGEECGLLHTELSEAVEAYRTDGLKRWSVWDDGFSVVADQKHFLDDPAGFDYHDAKPEGVASEIADTLIRLLDNYAERDLVPYEEGSQQEADARSSARHLLGVAIFEKLDRMPPVDLITILHTAVTEIYFSTNEFVLAGDHWSVVHSLTRESFDRLLWMLFRISDILGIDLIEEFEAKMKYNETRSHRHGGKLL